MQESQTKTKKKKNLLSVRRKEKETKYVKLKWSVLPMYILDQAGISFVGEWGNICRRKSLISKMGELCTGLELKLASSRFTESPLWTALGFAERILLSGQGGYTTAFLSRFYFSSHIWDWFQRLNFILLFRFVLGPRCIF